MTLDPVALAHQLRKPDGDFGEEVGQKMAEFNAAANAWTLELLDIRPRDHVLEIGFGPGEALAEAVRLTPQGYVAGIDHSETMRSMAGKRNNRALMQEHLELSLGAADELPYPDAGFDKVFAVNVVYFWQDAERCCAEIARVMKPDGRCVLFMTRPDSWFPGLKDSGVFIAREPAEFEAMLKGAGFASARSVERKLGDADCVTVIGER
jgi:SAM-dependent methyltransferase